MATKADELTLGYLMAVYVYWGLATELRGGKITGFQKEKKRHPLRVPEENYLTTLYQTPTENTSPDLHLN